MGMIGNAPAAGTIGSGNIQDGDIQTADLANGAVTAAKLASTAVTDKLGFTPANKAGDIFANGSFSSTAAKIAVGDGQYGLSSAGGVLYLHTAANGAAAVVVNGTVAGNVLHTGNVTGATLSSSQVTGALGYTPVNRGVSSAWSNTYTTTTAWNGAWNTIIPHGTLGGIGATHVVNLWWYADPMQGPYYVNGVTLFHGSNTNGTGVSDAWTVSTATHTGSTGYQFSLRYVAGSQSTSGLQISWGSLPAGILVVKVQLLGV